MKIIMKKIIVIALVVCIAKPAFALKIDAAQIATKISDFTVKITDATSKVTDGISKAKEIASKGFNKEGLLDAVISKLPFDPRKVANPDAILGDIIGGLQGAAVTQIETTIEKEKEILQAEIDYYTESTRAYYDAQVEILNENLNEINSKKQEVERELTLKKQEAESKKSACNSARQRGDDNTQELCIDYETIFAEVTNLEMSSKELELAKEELENGIEVLNDEASKVGTEEDATYMQHQAELEALENTNNEAVVISAEIKEDDEWDSNGTAEKLVISDETYRAFLRKYFYDPTSVSLKEDGGTDLVEDQNEVERARRFRRQLVLSTAAHLLQVSASVRREIPERLEATNEMYEGVISTDSELEAIGYYAGTRMENMRTLLLYAKILSAKLQYMAAKDLLITELRRRGNVEDATMSNFELSRYKLTQEYVDAIEKESNEVRDLHKGIEE